MSRLNFMSQLNFMNHWTDRGLDTAQNIFDYAQNLVDPSIKLGVTGLSRSGKTVFITSLVYHLLQQDNLRFFEPLASGRIQKVYLQPHPNDLLPRFDYEGNLQKLLSDNPTWPEGTRHLSQLRLTIEYQSDQFPARLIGTSKLHIDIIDYPGEWLLDLPLLDQNYHNWSKAAFTFANEPQNQPLAKAWLELNQTISPDDESNEGIAKTLSDSFAEFLILAHQKNPNLVGFPPGRFLMPGDLKDAPALTFAPLSLNEKQEIKPNTPNTMAALMQRRFKSYQQDVVRPFYRKFFTQLDRQIVLVDVISVLNAGNKHLSHLEQTLTEILKSFNPGSPHWLTSIWNKKIDRLVFAATKADHLHHTNHDRLQTLLSHITQNAIHNAKAEGAQVKVQALASLRTTKEIEIDKSGSIYNALQGTPVKGETFQGTTFDGKKEIMIFPGDLPDTYPPEPDKSSPEKVDQAQLPNIDIINFAPPPKSVTPVMPHIRLDRALNMLIGDKLT